MVHYDTCDASLLKYEHLKRIEWTEILPTIDTSTEDGEHKRDILLMTLDVQKMGTTCPVPPYAKI